MAKGKATTDVKVSESFSVSTHAVRGKVMIHAEGTNTDLALYFEADQAECFADDIRRAIASSKEQKENLAALAELTGTPEA